MFLKLFCVVFYLWRTMQMFFCSATNNLLTHLLQLRWISNCEKTSEMLFGVVAIHNNFAQIMNVDSFLSSEEGRAGRGPPLTFGETLFPHPL